MTKRKKDTTDNDVIKSSYDSLLNPSEDDEDDFFERFDRLHGVADSQILAQEIEDELEKTTTMTNFTQALEALSGEDKDYFERSQMIHFDREEPFETQMFHAINLQKRKEAQRNYVIKVTVMLMVIGILVCAIGILANKMLFNQPLLTASHQEESNPALSADTAPVSIDEHFNDDAFTAYIKENFDKNSDGQLDYAERNNVLIINISGDTRIKSLEGIDLFPLLQALNISYTEVETIDCSKNTLLENLNIKGSMITSLDVSSCEKISVIDVSDSVIQELRLPDVSKVAMLNCDHTDLECSFGNDGYYTACHLK